MNDTLTEADFLAALGKMRKEGFRYQKPTLPLFQWEHDLLVEQGTLPSPNFDTVIIATSADIFEPSPPSKDDNA